MNEELVGTDRPEVQTPEVIASAQRLHMQAEIISKACINLRERLVRVLREDDQKADSSVPGPSYATQRQESATHLLQLTQAIPQQMAIASDLIVKNMDFKDADEVADRLRKTLPPGIVPPKPGDKPPQPPQPSPEQIAPQAKVQQSQISLEIEKLPESSRRRS